MGDVYKTKDILEVCDSKLNALAQMITKDETLTDEQIVTAIRELQAFRKFEHFIAEELAERDRQYNEDMEAWKKRQAEKAAGDNQ